MVYGTRTNIPYDNHRTSNYHYLKVGQDRSRGAKGVALGRIFRVYDHKTNILVQYIITILLLFY